MRKTVSNPTAAALFTLLAAAAQAQMPVQLRPDLIVEVRQAGKGVPSAYIVRNIGDADAGPSVLKVSVFLAPTLGPGSFGKLNPPDEVFNVTCKPPLQGFAELIPAVKAGESKAVTRSGLFSAVLKMPLQKPPSGLQSYWECTSPAFVCVYEVKATVDDRKVVQESNENNNQTVRVVERRAS